MKLFLASDHVGYETKESLKEWLSGLGHEVKDFGASSYVEDDDYPDVVVPLATELQNEPEVLAIILGGSGQGEAICANRFKAVRAGVFYGPLSAKREIDIRGTKSTDPFEIVRLLRSHNDSNVLSLGIRFLAEDEIKKAIEVFLTTPFSKEDRHIRRIGKLNEPIIYTYGAEN